MRCDPAEHWKFMFMYPFMYYIMQGAAKPFKGEKTIINLLSTHPRNFYLNVRLCIIMRYFDISKSPLFF